MTPRISALLEFSWDWQVGTSCFFVIEQHPVESALNRISTVLLDYQLLPLPRERVFYSKVAEVEVGIFNPSVLSVDNPCLLSIIDEVLGEVIVVTGDGLWCELSNH